MMKKIFALVLLLVLGKLSYAQYPITQTLGSDSTIVISKGALQSRLINVTYTDTTAANLQRIRQYPGAQIATTTGGLNLWIRNATATAWIPVATGSGNNIYTIDGTLLGNRTLTGAGYSLTFNQLSKLLFNADSTTINTDQATILNNGVSTLSVKGAIGRMFLVDTTAPADERIYELKSSNGEFYISILNDAQTSNDSAFLITSASRVGINTLNPDSTLKVGGGVNIVGGLRVGNLPTSPGTKQLRINAQGQFSATDTLIDAGGTVTSIATNNGSGITGGTITTTGTLAIDTTIISTKANVSGGLAGKLNISDTAAMLNPYLRKVDTASLSNRINLKLNISDTASMLGNYLNNVGYGLSKAGQVVSADSATLSNYYLRRKDSLTTTNPIGYVTKKILSDTAAAIRSADAGGTVTSVGLTMPVAFNVAGSPVTSSGTLAVTGAGLASQYIRGDGTLADFPGGGGGGGASISYYLNGSVNQGTFGGNTYYEMNKTPIFGAGTDFSINADGYIAQFITDAGDPGLLKIPGGNWNFETFFSASSGGGNPTYYVELYKYDGTTFTLIASGSTNPDAITGGASVEAYFSTLPVPETVLLATDRLAVRIYVTHAGRTITLHTEDNNLCQIITTFTTGITALNGLTDQVQYFATGTSGTDFNISSVTATHTFNLPTASATNRGALSTTDWSTFNNKIGPSDTASMLSPYLRKADTTAMLNPYFRLAGVGLKNTGQTVYADTLLLSTRAWRQKGIDSVAALANTKISGSLISGYLTKATGTLTVDTSQIYQNNGNIGIGTISPASGYKVDMVGSLRVGNGSSYNKLTINGNTVGSYLNFQKNGTNKGDIGPYSAVLGGVPPYSGSNDDLTYSSVGGHFFNTNAGVKMYLNNAGNLGLSASPDSMLTVLEGAYFQRGVRMSGLPSAPGTRALRINANGTLSVADTLVDAGGTVTSVATNNGTGITGGTITTTGTLAIDTLLISTRAWRQKGIDSVAALANSKVSSVSGTSPIASSGGTSPTISISQSSGSTNGFLSSTDWTTFNNKQNALTLTTTGTSGAATLVGSTLNIPQYQGVLTNPVTGTGTTNYIPKFTSSSAIGNSAIYDNGGNIGIGLTDAQSPLEVQSNSGGTAIRIRGRAAANSGTLRFFTNDGVTQQAKFEASDNAIEIGALTNVPLLFYTNGSERMRLDASGNLGINTSSPSYKLDVNGTISGATVQTTSRFIVNSTSNAGISDISLGSYANGSWLNTPSGTTGYLSVAGSAAYSYSKTIHSWYTDAGGGIVEKMRLDASGNLGLGVTPSAWGSNRTALQFGALGAIFSDNNVTSEIGANVYISTAPAYTYITSNYATRFTQINGQFQWHQAASGTAGNAISFTQAMTLNASGNLSIGNTNDTYKLDVSGTGRFYRNDSGNISLTLTNAYINQGNLINFVHNSGGSTTNGYIGHGGDSTGNFVIINNSITALSLARSTGAATFSSSVTATSFNGTTNNIFSVNGTEGMRLTTTGLGIGTTSPNSILQIKGAFNIERSNTTDYSIIDNEGNLNIKAATGGGGGSFNTVFFTGGSERMRITSAGDLLIATTTDAGAYPLQVNGSVYATAYYESSDLRLKNVLSERQGSDGINTITFKWKDGRDSLTHIGYAAQQVEKVLPDAVKTNTDGYKTINYDEVQSLKIANLEQEIAELKKIIKQLIDKK